MGDAEQLASAHPCGCREPPERVEAISADVFEEPAQLLRAPRLYARPRGRGRVRACRGVAAQLVQANGVAQRAVQSRVEEPARVDRKAVPLHLGVEGVQVATGQRAQRERSDVAAGDVNAQQSLVGAPGVRPDSRADAREPFVHHEAGERLPARLDVATLVRLDDDGRRCAWAAFCVRKPPFDLCLRLLVAGSAGPSQYAVQVLPRLRVDPLMTCPLGSRAAGLPSPSGSRWIRSRGARA